MRLFLAAAVAAAIVPVAAKAETETLTLRADVWCPYNCEPNDALPGYMVEIAKAALEPKYKVDYQNLNWARAIAEAREGKYSGLVGAANSDAPDFVFPPSALGVGRNCFYVKPDSTWTYKGLDSLKGIAVGVIKDYSYDENEIDGYIKANAKDAKKIDIVSGDNGLDLNVKKTLAGRIGAFIEEENVIKSYLFKKKLPENAVKSAGCVKESELFVAFSPKQKDAKELAKIVGDKVEAMRKDGSLKTLLAKYGIADWKK
jgi:polar amino acid transport system substrate-binding protein